MDTSFTELEESRMREFSARPDQLSRIDHLIRGGYRGEKVREILIQDEQAVKACVWPSIATKITS